VISPLQGKSLFKTVQVRRMTDLMQFFSEWKSDLQ